MTEHDLTCHPASPTLQESLSNLETRRRNVTHSVCRLDLDGGAVPLFLCHMLQKDFQHPPFLALSPAFRNTIEFPPMSTGSNVNCLTERRPNVHLTFLSRHLISIHTVSFSALHFSGSFQACSLSHSLSLVARRLGCQ